jgi:hypothetical protein
MKKLSIIGVLLPLLAAFPQVSHAVPSFPNVYTLDELGTADTPISSVILDVRNEGTNTVTVNVSLGAGTVADIQGIFFNFDGGSPSGIHVVDATGSSDFLYSYNVTSSDFSGNVTDLGNGVNMNGVKNPDTGNQLTFDGGVKIGTSGIGQGDDIQTTSFCLTTLPSNSSGIIDLTDYLGA